MALVIGLIGCGKSHNSSKNESNDEATEMTDNSFDESSSNRSYSASGTSYSDDSESSSSEDESTGSSSGSGDKGSMSSAEIDEALKSYEKYVDKSIALLKRAHKGDAAAIQEYASASSYLQDFTNKLDRAKSDFTSSQMEKLNRLNNKLLTAVATYSFDATKGSKVTDKAGGSVNPDDWGAPMPSQDDDSDDDW